MEGDPEDRPILRRHVRYRLHHRARGPTSRQYTRQPRPGTIPINIVQKDNMYLHIFLTPT